jgi:peptidoglycan/LPS O-acetylase OafA/YrhL
MLFHAYARSPAELPYGDRFSGFPLFSYGWLGVELFFLISGFVIFMTLENCTGVLDFIRRRWLRLFPAMLICSIFVWLTGALFPERPDGVPVAGQLISSLTLISPEWLQVIGVKSSPIEGSFWTLFIEVQFYLVAGLAYFLVGRRGALVIILALFFSGVLARHYYLDHIFPDWLTAFSNRVGTIYYGWFATGALFCSYRSGRSNSVLAVGIVVAVFAVITQPNVTAMGYVPVALIASLFIATLLTPKMGNAMRHPAFVFMGFISYPLYLIHENMMVAMITKADSWFPYLPQILLPVLPITCVIAMAWLVASYLEPWTRKAVRTLIELPTRRTRNEEAIAG